MNFNLVFFLGWAIIILFIVGFFVKLYFDARRRLGNYTRAIPAKAKIVKVGRSYTSGTWGGQDIDFSMEVIPPSGSPYEVKATWSVEPLSLPKIKEGKEIAIRIDSKDAHKIYSAEVWAWSWHQTPLRYGDRIVIGRLQR